MISDNLAMPLAKVATHAFSKMVGPSKLSNQRILSSYWASFLLDPLHFGCFNGIVSVL